MTEKKITWSHSALKDFEGCARRYHEVKVLKKFPFQDTDQTRYGKDLHKAAEDCTSKTIHLYQNSLRLFSLRWMR
jgi:hypothetical protein